MEEDVSQNLETRRTRRSLVRCSLAVLRRFPCGVHVGFPSFRPPAISMAAYASALERDWNLAHTSHNNVMSSLKGSAPQITPINLPAFLAAIYKHTQKRVISLGRGR